MWLAQANSEAAVAAAYVLIILLIFLVQVAVLRWIIRVNVIIRNQEEIIALLRQFVGRH